MAVSCPEVMYGAYYPYLYSRAAGPSRSFYQYERFNQDLYSSSGVPLASSSASGSSHSPCSPILPPTAAAVAAAHNTAAAVVAAAQTANQSTSSLSASTSAAAAAAAASNLGLVGNPGVGGGGGGGGGVGVLGVGGGVGGIGGGGGSGLSVLGGGGVGAGGLNNPVHHSSRTHTKEEELGVATRSDADARLIAPHHHNESSCSSGPDSPRHHLHAGGGGGGGVQTKADMPLDTASSGHAQGRAQYLSATCVVFTNYSGDTASVVDEHFSRALNFANKDNKESNSPMSSRNFPPSFWNSNYVHPVPAPTHHQMSDLYTSDGGYATDPWVPHAAAAHYGSYAAHAAHAHAYHHNMAQYGSLLRLPQQYSHGSRLHHDQQAAHALESAAAYSSYPTMAGLEAQVQESSKDLYWF